MTKLNAVYNYKKLKLIKTRKVKLKFCHFKIAVSNSWVGILIRIEALKMKKGSNAIKKFGNLNMKINILILLQNQLIETKSIEW